LPFRSPKQSHRKAKKKQTLYRPFDWQRESEKHLVIGSRTKLEPQIQILYRDTIRKRPLWVSHARDEQLSCASCPRSGHQDDEAITITITIAVTVRVTATVAVTLAVPLADPSDKHRDLELAVPPAAVALFQAV